MRRFLALIGIASLAVAFAACSGTAATPAATATIAASVAPTVAATPPTSAADTGAAGAPAGPTGSANPHGDPALESTIPAEIGGEKLTITSTSAADLVRTGGNSAALTQVLTAVGRSPSDVTVAQGSTESGMDIIAIRIAGADPGTLLQSALGAIRSTQSSPAPLGSRNIAGKDFTTLTTTAAGASPTPDDVQYVYSHADVIYQIVGATDAQLNEVATKLP